MNIQFGAHPIYFGLIGFNLTAVIVAIAVLIIALIVKVRRKETWLFEIVFLLFLVSLTYMTLHGRLLQYVFPISLPEQPLIDNSLTINYFVNSVLTFMVIPLLAIFILNRKVSAENLGLKVRNAKNTAAYTAIGIAFAASLYLLADYFFHEQWVSGYTLDGLVTWVFLVTILSVFAQTLFYNGLIFNRYLGKESGLLLGLIAVFSFQSYVGPNALPWIICSMLTVSSELFVTWKTKSVYGAVLIAITVGLIELTLQII